MDKKALVIIDVQNGFINNYSAHVVDRIKCLAKSGYFNFVLATKFVNKKGSPYELQMGWKKLRSDKETRLADGLEELTDKTFVKNLYTPYTNEFNNYLTTNKIKTLYFVGIDTDTCVMKSAIDTFEHGLNPRVLTYYCASHAGISFHDSSINILKRYIGDRNVIKGPINSEKDLK